MRYLEDIRPGQVFELGESLAERSEVLDYARRYDPRPGNLEAGPEGAVASEWYLSCLYMRHFALGFLNLHASIVSPGLEHLSWGRPVREGERLRARAEVLEVRRSRSRPDRGLARTRGRLLADGDEPVLTVEAVNFFWCRTAVQPQDERPGEDAG